MTRRIRLSYTGSGHRDRNDIMMTLFHKSCHPKPVGLQRFSGLMTEMTVFNTKKVFIEDNR